jgi:predicted MPP superfamily phosphohydrolase
MAAPNGLVFNRGYAQWVEPYWLETAKYQLASDKISRPIRIVLLADYQADRLGDYERRAFREIVQLKPDMVLCAGDYLQPWKRDDFGPLCRETNAYLRTIGFSAPMGIFAVQGNSDRYGDWAGVFDGLDVTTFEKTVTVQQGQLSITGLTMADSFSTDLVVSRRPGFHIVLGHAPDFALGSIDADLLLAGHTHGGQVRLPLIGPLVTLSQVPRRWASGLTQLGIGRWLIVSRGVGMERRDAPRLRFLCRPQIVVIELVPDRASRRSSA